jgi:hypothetical protein
MPSSVLPALPGLRLAITDHDRPFHASTSVLWSLSAVLFEYVPATMQKLALLHEMLRSSLLVLPGTAMGTAAQVLPSHSSTRVPGRPETVT